MPSQKSSAARGYGQRWRDARAAFLQANPLCRMCAPRAVPATVVDHITPHRGDLTLFWRRSNWQPLCATHHNAHKQELEKSGTVRGASSDGTPLDPGHHWHKPGL